MKALTKELKKEYQTYSSKKLDGIFIQACCDGDLDIVSYLLTSTDLVQNANIHAIDNYGFRLACEKGHLNVVKYLLTSPELYDHADIHADDDAGFQWAYRCGHLDVVRYLLTSPDLQEHANIHADDDEAFQYVCSHMRVDIICYFLSLTHTQRIDFQRTKYNLNWAIQNQSDDIIFAMMQNLNENNPCDGLEWLSKIATYNQKLFDKLQMMAVKDSYINSSVPELFL